MRTINWCNIVQHGNEQDYVSAAVEDGWWSAGNNLTKFERLLACSYESDSEFLAVANGTCALQLAFLTLGVKPADRVLVPSFCFQAAANVLINVGAIPVYCDVRLDSKNVGLRELKAGFDSSVVGLVVVYNYGMPCDDIEKIQSWARMNDLWIVEDCAEAWFVKSSGHFLGSYGDIATWSTHAAKTISTGEGGVVRVNNHSLLEKAIQIRSHGLVAAENNYLHKLPGCNFRMSNLHASIGLAQLEARQKVIELRSKINRAYYLRLREHQLITFQTNDIKIVEQLWAMALAIDFNSLSISRDELAHEMSKAGIQTRPGFYDVTSLNYCNEFISISENSRVLSEKIIVLPCSLDLTIEDIDFICSTLLTILHKSIRAAIASD